MSEYYFSEQLPNYDVTKGEKCNGITDAIVRFNSYDWKNKVTKALDDEKNGIESCLPLISFQYGKNILNITCRKFGEYILLGNLKKPVSIGPIKYNKRNPFEIGPINQKRVEEYLEYFFSDKLEMLK